MVWKFGIHTLTQYHIIIYKKPEDCLRETLTTLMLNVEVPNSITVCLSSEKINNEDAHGLRRALKRIAEHKSVFPNVELKPS